MFVKRCVLKEEINHILAQQSRKAFWSIPWQTLQLQITYFYRKPKPIPIPVRLGPRMKRSWVWYVGPSDLGPTWLALEENLGSFMLSSNEFSFMKEKWQNIGFGHIDLLVAQHIREREFLSHTAKVRKEKGNFSHTLLRWHMDSNLRFLICKLMSFFTELDLVGTTKCMIERERESICILTKLRVPGR